MIFLSSGSESEPVYFIVAVLFSSLRERRKSDALIPLPPDTLKPLLSIWAFGAALKLRVALRAEVGVGPVSTVKSTVVEDPG